MKNYTKQLRRDTRFEAQEWLQDLAHFAKGRPKTTMEERAEKIIRRILKNDERV